MKFKVGDKVKLKKYGPFSDYETHDGEVAILRSIHNYDSSFDWRIDWSDGEFSLAHTDNLIPVEKPEDKLFDKLKKEVEEEQNGRN